MSPDVLTWRQRINKIHLILSWRDSLQGIEVRTQKQGVKQKEIKSWGFFLFPSGSPGSQSRCLSQKGRHHDCWVCVRTIQSVVRPQLECLHLSAAELFVFFMFLNDLVWFCVLFWFIFLSLLSSSSCSQDSTHFLSITHKFLRIPCCVFTTCTTYLYKCRSCDLILTD